MTQKERIIELVKQNIISMEEALQLLEAANQQNATTDLKQEELIEMYEQVAEEKITNESEEVNHEEKLEELIANRDKKQEALLIAKQRLRELEILSELDDLTSEMEATADDLRNKVTKLEAEMIELEASIASEQQKSYAAAQETIRKFADDTASQVKQAAATFSKQARKEGRSLQKTITEGLRSFADHFEDVSINMVVPWIKSRNVEHTFIFKADQLTSLDVNILNGSVNLVSDEGEEIVINADITYYGKEEENLVSTFINLNTIDQVDDQLIFHVTHPKTAVDIEMKVPKKVLDKLVIITTNGDTHIKGVELNKLMLDSKNGDIAVEETRSNLWELSSLNGDVKIIEAEGQDLDARLLNGDYRFKGAIQTMSAETVNGDLLITMQDSPQAKLNFSTATGDIKVAVGTDANLSIKASTNFGETKNRVSNLSDLGKGYLERTLMTSDQCLIVEAKTTMGDIFLKD